MGDVRRHSRGVVNRRRHKGTHQERVEFARKLWREDPSLPMGTNRGVAALVEAKFGLVPRLDQLQEVHAEVAREQREKAKRDAIIEAQANRQPVISLDDARRLRLLGESNAPAEPTGQNKESENKKEIENEVGRENEVGMKPRPQKLHAKNYWVNGRAPRPYPQEFRDAVIKAVEERDESKEVREVCESLGIPEQTYYTWLRKTAGLDRKPVARETTFERRPADSVIERARNRVAVFEDREENGTSMSQLAAKFDLSMSSILRYTSQRDKYVEAKALLAKYEPEPEAEPPKPKPSWEAVRKAVASDNASRVATDTRDAIAAAVRMLLDEVPELANLTITRAPDSPPSIEYAVHTVIKEAITL